MAVPFQHHAHASRNARLWVQDSRRKMRRIGMPPNRHSLNAVARTVLCTLLACCHISSISACRAVSPSNSNQHDSPEHENGPPNAHGLQARATPQVRHHFTRLIMGVEANITIESELPRDQVEQAARACFDRLAQLDAIFSDYKRDSELNNLTKQPINTPTKVSSDLFLIISQAQHISDITNGAFDITIGPYVALWRTARSTGTLPTKEQLADAKQRVGNHLISLNQANQTITLHANNMKLDLGGIAKGYAAEAGIKVLKAQGFPRCLVALAGDVATGDAPLTSEPTEPPSLGWRIDIDSDHSTTNSLRLKNRSVSTSGDTQQFIDIAGIRYSHIVDPRTGLGAVGTTPVTIVGPDGAITDALATAFTIMSDVQREAARKHFKGYTTP